MVESNLDTAGSCTSQCCETVVSEVSSSSSEHTHASRHALSRPSFDTLPPGHGEIDAHAPLARSEADLARDKVATK